MRTRKPRAPRAQTQGVVELAKRLGVAPLKTVYSGGSYVIRDELGQWWDVQEIIAAWLKEDDRRELAAVLSSRDAAL